MRQIHTIIEAAEVQDGNSHLRDVAKHQVGTNWLDVNHGGQFGTKEDLADISCFFFKTS